MLQRLAMIVALGLLVSYGVFEGVWTERWLPSAELRQAQARMESIPKQVGTWESEDQTLDEDQVRIGDIGAHLVRTYTDRTTGQKLAVLVVAGRPGPISVHAPEVCLGGNGFNLEGRPQCFPDAKEAKQGDDTFWHGVFAKAEVVVPERMEVYWSWNPGTGWLAAPNPRWTFARNRYLYKIYVSRAVPNAEAKVGGDDSPIPEFLSQLLPQVNAALFPQS